MSENNIINSVHNIAHDACNKNIDRHNDPMFLALWTIVSMCKGALDMAKPDSTEEPSCTGSEEQKE